MAIGRTFQESLQKALRGLEIGSDGFDEKTHKIEVIKTELGHPGPNRIWYVGDAFRHEMTIDEIHHLTRAGHDPQKIYAAYHEAVNTKGQPVLILIKSVKAFGLGDAGESKNIAHNAKKLNFSISIDWQIPNQVWNDVFI